MLGGGFGGRRRCQEAEGADADVVLVDKHDYHTFQPLLYQVATDLLEPPPSAIRCATSSTSSRTSRSTRRR